MRAPLEWWALAGMATMAVLIGDDASVAPYLAAALVVSYIWRTTQGDR